MFETEGLDHVALAVRDVDRSIAWYQEVLGLERRHEDEWGNEPAIVGRGTTALALFEAPVGAQAAEPDRNIIKMLHLAFRVNAVNFLAAQKSLRERDIRFAFRDHGAAQSIYFPDPDGHRIEITTWDV